MTDLEYCKYAYKQKWATKGQLRIWVLKGKIFDIEYKEICGEDFK